MTTTDTQTRPPIAHAAELLTARQVEILQTAADGLTAADAARRLWVTQATIRTTMATIRGRLGARNTAQAVAIALRAGVLR